MEDGNQSSPLLTITLKFHEDKIYSCFEDGFQNRFDPRSMPYRSLCEFLTKQAHLLESAAVLLRSTVANARERRNDDQLSHPLPTELLYLIFTYLISDRALECNTDLVHASHVCRRWRTAALGNSSLWTLFDVNGSRRMHDKAQAFMERSGDNLIDVYCSRGPRRISVPPILEGLLPVSKKSHLIRSLIINRRDELMAPLFLQSIWAEGFASHLRTLHILGSENIPERHGDPFASIAVNGLRMFEENISGDPRWTPTPLLRSLRLHGFHLHWNSPAYRNLTELELRIPDVEPPSQRQLLRILKACPDLRRLDLRLSGIAGPFVAAAHRVWDVSLPNLDTLSLNMPPPASIATVLEHLILPPTTRYSLESTEVGDAPLFPDDLSRLPGLGHATIVRASIELPFQVDVDKPVIKVTCTHAAIGSDDDPVLTVRFRAWETTGPVLRTLPRALDLVALETLSVSGRVVPPPDGRREAPWEAFLLELPALRTLRLIRPDARELSMLFGAFGYEGGPAPGPALEDLELVEPVLTQGLMGEMVRHLATRKLYWGALDRLVLTRASGIQEGWLLELRLQVKQMVVNDS